MTVATPELFVELRMDRDLARLSLVKNTAESFLARAGLPDDEIYRSVIGIYEAFSNVVEHAYGEEREGEVVLTMTLADREIVIEIRDWGQSFDISSVKEIEWENYLASGKKRGLGVHLMRQVMDDIQYTPGEENVLVMRRKIRDEAPSGEAPST